MPEHRSACMFCPTCRKRYSTDATHCTACKGKLVRKTLDEIDPRRMHTPLGAYDRREQKPQ